MPILISDPDRFKKFIYGEAKRQGFDLVGLTSPEAIDQAANRLEAAIALGHHGTMDWMEETLARRKNPLILWPQTRSIIMLALNYGPDEDPLLVHTRKNCGVISVYARHRDYHELIKGRLKQLASRLVARARQMGVDDMEVKVFVDTAPVMEKPLAEAAGLGWQGKHTNLVSRQLGSWIFLGSIFTNVMLEPDSPARASCGSCSACLQACPTQAFPAPYQLDAKRCISYLTIELKTHIPLEFRQAMGNRIYGCDDCLAVCPWNKFAQATREIKLQARDDLKAPSLKKLLQLDESQFRIFFSGSPIKRIGFVRFIRNVLLACGNSGEERLIGDVIPFLASREALLRGMAIWALKQLMTVYEFDQLRQRHQSQELDESVRLEWQDLEQLPKSGSFEPQKVYNFLDKAKSKNAFRTKIAAKTIR